jgi:hypothetical protein
MHAPRRDAAYDSLAGSLARRSATHGPAGESGLRGFVFGVQIDVEVTAAAGCFQIGVFRIAMTDICSTQPSHRRSPGGGSGRLNVAARGGISRIIWSPLIWAVSRRQISLLCRVFMFSFGIHDGSPWIVAFNDHF